MDLNTPESAEMAEQVLKKFWQRVAEQKLSASLKCVIDMLVKQSNGMPAEAKQVELAWKAFDDAQWDFFELMEEEEDEAAAEDMEASYEKLMGKAVAILKAARENVEAEEHGTLVPSVTKAVYTAEQCQLLAEVESWGPEEQEHLEESTMQDDNAVIKAEQVLKEAGEELRECDSSFPHEPGASIELSKGMLIKDEVLYSREQALKENSFVDLFPSLKEATAHQVKASQLIIEKKLEEQVEVVRERLEEMESTMQADVIKEKPDAEKRVIKAAEEEFEVCDSSFPHQPGAIVEMPKAEAEKGGEIKADEVESSDAKAGLKLAPIVKDEVEEDCHESVPLHIDKQDMVEVEMFKPKEVKINIKAAQKESSQDAKAGSELAPIVKDKMETSRISKAEAEVNIVMEKADVSKKVKQRTEDEKLLRLNQVEVLCLWLLVVLWPPDEVKLKECSVKQGVILKEERLNVKEEVLHELTPLKMDRLLPPARLTAERATLLGSEYPFEQYCQG